MSIAEEKLEFAYSVEADVVSSYLWRGTFCGGLSFQPTVEIGWESENTTFTAGVFGNIGAEDWTFKKNSTCDYDKSGINPELDVYMSFNLWGAVFGASYYHYFGKYNDDPRVFGDDSQTEVFAGVDFESFLDIPLTLTWYTMVAGDDIDTVTNKRAWSSYLEATYTHDFGKGYELQASLGITPWKSLYTDYEGNFAVNLLALQASKEWNINDICTMTLWARGELNTYNIGKEAGRSAIQGCIGYSVCF